MQKRFWEIDFVRGLAVVFMVLFNYAFTLDYLRIYTLTEGWLFWWLFPRLVAGAFIFIAGVSLTISYSRNKSWGKHIRRGLMIFSFGLLITAATWLFVPSATVWFGALHFIGLAVILSLLFVKWKPKYLAAFGIAALLIGAYLNSLVFDFPWLLWLGFIPSVFTTLDYFPLLPWLGVFLIGMAFGKKYYKNGKRRFTMSEIKNTGPITFLGRHSLIIYLLHQPILLLILRGLGLF